MTTPLTLGDVIEPRKTDAEALKRAKLRLNPEHASSGLTFQSLTRDESNAVCDELAYLEQLESILYPQWEKQNKELMRLSKENEELRERLAGVERKYGQEIGNSCDLATKCGELKSQLSTLSERVRNETRNRLWNAVNAECSCGGEGPNDPGVCDACLVWHRFNESLKSPGQTGGNHD